MALPEASHPTLLCAGSEAWIDALAGLWLVNAGHGRREIAEAMAEQASKLAYVSSAAYTSVPAMAAGLV